MCIIVLNKCQIEYFKLIRTLISFFLPFMHLEKKNVPKTQRKSILNWVVIDYQFGYNNWLNCCKFVYIDHRIRLSPVQI